MHICKSHCTHVYYNTNNDFKNYHFDRNINENNVKTMYSVSKIFKYCINASRFVYIFQKHTRETKKLSLFFFSRRSAINTIHPLYVVEEETPKRETSEARRINPPRFPATSPFSTVSLSLSLSFVFPSCLLAAHGFTPLLYCSMVRKG